MASPYRDSSLSAATFEAQQRLVIERGTKSSLVDRSSSDMVGQMRARRCVHRLVLAVDRGVGFVCRQSCNVVVVQRRRVLRRCVRRPIWRLVADKMRRP